MYPNPYTTYNYNLDNNVKNPIECIMFTPKNKYEVHQHPTQTPLLTSLGIHITVVALLIYLWIYISLLENDFL